MTVRELIAFLVALEAPDAEVLRRDPTGHEGMTRIHSVERLTDDTVEIA